MTRLRVCIVLFDKQSWKRYGNMDTDDAYISNHYVYVTGVDDQFCYIEKKDKPMPEDNDITLLEDKLHLRNRAMIPNNEIIDIFGADYNLPDIIRGYGKANKQERKLALDLFYHNLISTEQF